MVTLRAALAAALAGASALSLAAAQESIINDIGFSAEFGTAALYGEFDAEPPGENVFLVAALARGAYEVETRSDFIDRISLELEAMVGITEGDVDSSTGSGIFLVEREADVKLDYSTGLFAVLTNEFEGDWAAFARAGINYSSISATIRDTLGVEREIEETSLAPVLGAGLKRRIGKSSSLRFDLGYYWLANEYLVGGVAYSHRF